MAFQFPPSPAVNQTFTPVAGVTYRWSGTAWHLLAGPGSFITAADADVRYVNVDEVSNTINRIINGKFQIDQRNAGAVVAAANTQVYGPDRWFAQASGAGTVRLTRQIGSAALGEYLLYATSLVADASLTGADFYILQQTVEGYNIADLYLGSAAAKSFTFAFELYTPPGVSGTLPIAFRGAAASRSYIATIALTANTTKTYSITVPGDVSGTWDATNGQGMLISFALGAGPTLQAPSVNTWVAGNFLTVAGATNFMATAPQDVFVIANVRLYKGSVDFGPDRRLYAEELALCQRYYEKTFRPEIAPAAGTNLMDDGICGRGWTAAAQEPSVMWQFKVEKRATPTVALYNLRPGGAAGQWTNMGGVDSANARAVYGTTSRVYLDNAGQPLTAASNWHIAATASAEL